MSDDDRVFVAAEDGDRIQEFNGTGGFVRTLGSSGGGAGQCTGPDGVAIGGAGRISVADTGNNRLVRLHLP